MMTASVYGEELPCEKCGNYVGIAGHDSECECSAKNVSPVGSGIPEEATTLAFSKMGEYVTLVGVHGSETFPEVATLVSGTSTDDAKPLRPPTDHDLIGALVVEVDLLNAMVDRGFKSVQATAELIQFAAKRLDELAGILPAHEHLINYALQKGFVISVECEGEELISRSADKYDILEHINSVDECELVIRSAPDKREGWAHVITYDLEPEEMVVDYGVNNLMEEWNRRYLEYFQSTEK